MTLKDAIDLSGTSQATLTFSWLIESGLDTGEYLALDLWNGTAWNEVARLRGDVDAEDVWHDEEIDLSDYLIGNFKLRFRGTMSLSIEDANVDVVRIMLTPSPTPTPTPSPTPTPAPTPTPTPTPTPSPTPTPTPMPSPTPTPTPMPSPTPTPAPTPTPTPNPTPTPAPDEVFFDSFDDSALSNWVQGGQDDWFCSTQRAVEGSYSAEVDGWAVDATMTLKDDIDLSGMSQATLTFSWLIESGVDTGEYLALDLWNGTAWNEVARLRGDVDAEDVWHGEVIDLSDYLIGNFKLQFRGTMSRSDEDANVDVVRIEGIPSP
jgi:hypothetical protein